MEYNLDDANEVKLFPVGEKIDDVILMGAKVDEKGTLSVGFQYKPADVNHANYGGVVRYMEWNPDNSTSIGTEEQQKNNESYIRSRVFHLLNRLYSEEEAKAQTKGNDWMSWVNKIAELVNAKKGTKFSIKAVYNKKNFVSLPRFPSYLSTEFSPTVFSTNPTYDWYVKQNQNDSDNASSLPTPSAGNTTPVSEDVF